MPRSNTNAKKQTARKAVINFRSQFARAIETGSKKQTIRRQRKHPIRVGDRLQLYTGLQTPKTRLIKSVICVKITPIEVYPNEIVLNGEPLAPRERAEFVRRDGFQSESEFFDFFKSTYPIFETEPFFGEVIEWN